MKTKIIYILNVIFLLFIAESRSYVDASFGSGFSATLSVFHGKKAHPDLKIDHSYSKKNRSAEDTAFEVSDHSDYRVSDHELVPSPAAFITFAMQIGAAISTTPQEYGFPKPLRSVKLFLCLHSLRI